MELQQRNQMQLAKAKDKVVALEQRIESLSALCDRKSKSIETCQKIMDSKAYPMLDPLMNLLKKSFDDSLQRKNSKLDRVKTKKSKATDKVIKAQRKIQRSEMLSNFLKALTTSPDQKSAFLIGMKAVHEDSVFRAVTKYNKCVSKIQALAKKLENAKLSNEEQQKLTIKAEKLQKKMLNLTEKLKKLSELERNLTELADLPKEKIEPLAQATAEQIQSAVENNENINKAVDEVATNVAQATNAVLQKPEPEQQQSVKKAVDEAEKNEENSESKTNNTIDEVEKNEENSESKANNTEKKAETAKPKSTELTRTVTQEEALAIMASGVVFNRISRNNTGELQIYFDKSIEQQMKAVVLHTAETQKMIKR